MILWPKKYSKRKKVAIWAPSSPAGYLFPKRLERSLKYISNILGMKIKLTPSCTINYEFNEEYLKKLANQFHELLNDDEVNIIIFLSGGWTTISLLRFIDWKLVKEKRKNIVGYSDATVFLLACLTKSELITHHGPMVISEFGEYGGCWKYTKDNFLNAICGYKSCVMKAPNHWTDESLWWDKEDSRKRRITGAGDWKFLKKGAATGRLVGGNFNSMMLLIGTEYLRFEKNDILFIETNSYSPEKFLAFLTQLDYIGVFELISGMIVGRHSSTTCENYNTEKFNEIIMMIINVSVNSSTH